MRRIRLAATALAAALATGTLVLGTSTAAADSSCSKTISIGDAQASEGAGEIKFPVTMFAPIGCPLIGSVQFSTVSLIVPNPAGNGDYTSKLGQVTWPSPGTGPGLRWISIALLQNPWAEVNEQFGVTLHGATGASITDDLAIGTIIDDDPSATLVQPPIPLSAEDSTPRCIVEISIELSAPAATQMTVSWTAVDGTATFANNDYGVANGTVPIPANASSGKINMPVSANVAGEPQEYFYIVLTGVTPGRIGSGQVQVVIPQNWG